MISDQGREFVSKVKEALFELTGTQDRVTSAYHPQTNALTEQFNQTLQTSLLKVSITPSYLMASRYSIIIVREYGSTLYVGMTREKNGGRIKRVH